MDKNTNQLSESNKKNESKNLFEGFDIKKDAYPLLDSQMGIYLECYYNPNSCIYNIPIRYSFPKSLGLDIQKIKASVIKIINSYPFMHICIKEVNGRPSIIPNDVVEYDIPIKKIDSSELSDEIKNFIRPFDLSTPPIFRFEILDLPEEFMLLGDIHHLISDGGSLMILFNQITDVYEGKPVADEPINSFVLSNYEENIKEREEYHKSMKYYDDMLSGVEVDSNIIPDEGLDDIDNQIESTIASVKVSDRVSCDDLREKLKELDVKEIGLFLGAFAYALAKMNCDEEALFYTVNHGRFIHELRSTMGMLVKTMPIYQNIDETELCKDFLKNVQDQFFTSIKQHGYSFVDLAKKHNLKANIIFVYQGDTLEGKIYKNELLPMSLIHKGDLGSNITMTIFKTPGGDYVLSFEYLKRLYKEETIKNFGNLMLSIIKGLLTEEKLCDIQFVESVESVGWSNSNNNTKTYDESLSVVDMFRKQVEETPDNLAISFKEKKYTYKELDEISERIAVFLTKEGISLEDPVGIMVERSERYPICALGILKAGGVTQPLDINYPEDRLLYMLEDSGAKFVFVDEELSDILNDYKGKIILTKEIANMQYDPGTLLNSPGSNNLFTLIYTSGSTGQPKGCMLEHKNIVNFCLSSHEIFNITKDDRTISYASFGFDASMFDFYAHLTKGASIYIVPEEIRLDFPRLNKFLLENEINLFFATTQLGRQYATSFKSNPYLRLLVVGGETLVPLDIPDYKIINIYGPTECCVFVCCFDVDKRYKSIPIGKALYNCDIYILDKYRRPLPVSAAGELVISGYPVGRGYLNKPETTEEKFISNPFIDTAGYEKMYLSGDIARYLPDGNLQIIGRKDTQVKIRGFRIEMAEIEKRIMSYENISSACVIARDLPSGGKELVAYVVSSEEVNVSDLDDFIREELPKYMVPSITMQVESIPVTQNGKVDKKKLPEPKIQINSNKYEAKPQNALEKKLVSMIEEIVGHSDFDLDTDLVAIGISSLTGIMLVTMIYDEFGCEINTSDILEDGTLLSLEDTILNHLMTEKSNEPDEKQQEDISESPLSSAQLGIYYDVMKRPQDLTYNIPMCYTLSKKTNIPLLKESIEKVYFAHPQMSANLKMVDGDVRQTLNPDKKPSIAVLEMTEAELSEYQKKFAKAFDLFEDALYRLCIVETEKRVVLLFDVHHIIFDGTSCRIFIEEIKRAYEGTELKGESKHFSEAVLDEKKFESGEKGIEAKKYYEDLLVDFENTSEITPDLQGDISAGELHECVATLDGSTIDAFCKEKTVTHAQLFLAGSLYAVSRYTGEDKVYMSMIDSGREDIKYGSNFGMFVKTLPLALGLEGSESSEDFILRVGTNMRQAIRYEQYPRLSLLDKYGYVSKINYACQLGLSPEVEIENQTVIDEVISTPLPKFYISIHVEEREGNPSVCVQYNNALYSEDFMQGFADAIKTSVLHMMLNSSKDIRNISLLTENTLELIDKFRIVSEEKIEISQLHKVFEKQASLYPDKTALIATDGEYSFSELDANMNRVANSLIKHGVNRGDKIAILLPRTSKQVIAMYATLKSGAAYIPCDTEYPVERLASIFEDSEAKYIITTKDFIKNFPDKQVLDIETLIEENNELAPNVQVDAGDLAYIIYTSGSTGKPKGVMLTHGGISNYVTNHPANIHVSALAKDASALVSVTTVSFDMSLKETAVALCNGITLILANEDEAMNVNMLAELMEKYKADAFNATPSRLSQYIGLPAFKKALSKCKVVMCGGEKYPQNLLENLKKITDARIFNTYGPTEITVSSNAKELTSASEVNVGKPLLNVSEYVVDSDGNRVPIGVVGELYVGGAGVAKGYLNNPEATEKSFVTYENLRVYKTGDYAKWTVDGDVVILGRKDNQIKLRGLRIELGEIEKVISEDKRVNEVIVLIRKVGEIEQLCAWYVADEKIDTTEMRDRLSLTLTQYMIPTKYIQLESMPMTANGKINSKALPLPTSILQETSKVMPANEIEHTLCDIYKDVLGLESVGTNDSFFDLGGSSLTVTSVLIDANNKNLNITYKDVFDYPTPKELAEFIKKDKGTATDAGISKDSFDYDQFNEILTSNNIQNYTDCKDEKLGNVLLTGATGFLGVHILKDLLDTEEGDIYCIVRGSANMNAESRLKSQLFYYFEDSFDEYFGKRIHVISGDATSSECISNLEDKSINTVINCAALVKHFTRGNEMEKINVGIVENLIEFCKKQDAMLIQISTGSIAGMSVDGFPSKDVKLTEQTIHIDQVIENKYVMSKFDAERLVLTAIKDGMCGKIMRVGNLAPREKDGEFQINFSTNGFMGRLRAYLIIGSFPYSMMDSMIEMAPIDTTAKAIILLAKSPRENIIFHPFNNHYIPLGDIITQMGKMGMKIDLVEDDIFDSALKKAQENEENAALLTTLLAYGSANDGVKRENISTDNEFTTQILYRKGMSWPITSNQYMSSFLDELAGLGFFSSDNE